MSPELNTYQQALCVRLGVQVPRNPYACPMGGVACLQFQPPKVETGESPEQTDYQESAYL